MKHKSVFIDLNDILPKESYVKEKLIVEKYKKFLNIYYLNRYPNGKKKNERFQPAKAKVPKRIILSDQLIETIGMYFGDGQSAITSKSYQSTRFANSNPRLIKLFIGTLKNLNVDVKKLKAYVSIITAIKPKNYQKIIDYWLKITNIPRSNFYKIGWRKSKWKSSMTEPYGTTSIIYANSSFRLVFDAIFKRIINIAKKDHRTAANFLRGLLAADGNIYYNGVLREVNIAAKSEKNRKIIKRFFLYLGINTNKDNLTPGKETVRITGYPNFEIMEKYSLCGLHQKKKEIFYNMMGSYKNKCFRKGTAVPKLKQMLKTPKTVDKIAFIMKKKQNAIRRYLYILEKEDKVKRIKNFKNKEKIGRPLELWVNK